MEFLAPPPLRPGDTLGVFTPSTPAATLFPEKYEHGISRLRALGFRVLEGSLTRARASQGYRSGSPAERAAEFMELIRNPEVRGLVSVLGGTGSASLIPYLDFSEIRRHPKIVCGFSDVTAIQLALLKFAGLRAFYGPGVLRSFGEWPEPLPETAESFLDAVQRHRQGRRRLEPPTRWSAAKGAWEDGRWNREPRMFTSHPGWRGLVPGQVSAPALIANLNTLVRAAGCDYFPELRGRLLLIEEMNCPLSKLERNLRQLERMGIFDVVAGLIVSKPEHFDAEGAPFGADELLLEILGTPTGALGRPRAAFPVVTGFDCGHTQPMLTLAQLTPLSLTVRPDGSVELWIDAPMVSPEYPG